MPAAGRVDEEPAGTDPDPARGPDGSQALPRPADPVIAAEHDYLLRAREFLRLMREDVLSLKAMAGDPVSEEYLKAGLFRPRSLRHDSGSLNIEPAPAADLGRSLREACAAAVTRPGSVAVIGADQRVAALSAELRAAGLRHAVLDGARAEDRITVVPVTLAKGLEFDQVIVVEPAEIAATGRRGPQRLYVALTRAVSRLTVLHAQPLPLSLGQAAA